MDKAESKGSLDVGVFIFKVKISPKKYVSSINRFEDYHDFFLNFKISLAKSKTNTKEKKENWKQKKKRKANLRLVFVPKTYIF